ncbi:PREDICTED: E3 ubiquitin-protein ligase ZNRF2-like [Cyprinodon variegatus]|uniref:E3 ubiquitin-protein ligase ZNRF2-like n=1 Tax=Cyprinodon variegatus TaxID=28743 RepID=A0A3Q2FN03_CYPVA|nr:PREDICTED: E3 ubiquitin-protein ligase ZNRF2-like [Cyprinodon variegatus]
MGAKQSSPSAPSPANGRTRAYSGSDLPSASSGRTTSTAEGVRYRAQGTSRASGAASSSGQPPGTRPTSAGGSSGPGSGARSGISIPNSGGVRSSPESGGSSPEEADQDRTRHGGARLVIGSLPAHLSPHLFGGKWVGVLTRFGSGTCGSVVWTLTCRLMRRPTGVIQLVLEGAGSGRDWFWKGLVLDAVTAV